MFSNNNSTITTNELSVQNCDLIKLEVDSKYSKFVQIINKSQYSLNKTSLFYLHRNSWCMCPASLEFWLDLQVAYFVQNTYILFSIHNLNSYSKICYVCKLQGVICANYAMPFANIITWRLPVSVLNTLHANDKTNLQDCYSNHCNAIKLSSDSLF